MSDSIEKKWNLSSVDLSSPSSLLGIAGALAAATGIGLYVWIRTLTDTPYEDLKELYSLIQRKKLLQKLSLSYFSCVDLFDGVAKRLPKKECFRFINDDGSVSSWTFEQLFEYSNQVANWALSIGIKKGDYVGLLMSNRLEFTGIWIGLAKVGATTALFNINLKPHSLGQCIKTSQIKLLIVEEELSSLVTSPEFQIPDSTKIPLYIYGSKNHKPSSEFEGEIESSIKSQSSSEVDQKYRDSVRINDPVLLIFTSGTTGLPKAAKFQHYRFFLIKLVWDELYHLTEKDRFYCPLPFYHSAASALGVGTLLVGTTLVFRKKFSVSHFWTDVVSNNCDAVQYIGEIARYLLNTPEKPEEKQHKVRFAFGNGMRKDIWITFKKRFNIPQIAEFYASTEGTVSFWNTDNKDFSVGRVRPLVAKISPNYLVKFDFEKEAPIRDNKGHCIVCKDGEIGELISLIVQNEPSRRFDGYTDKSATEKKILRNVFKEGDAYYRTGDLLYKDSQGYYYWGDRIGDTFRWKGENVATTEVEDILTRHENIAETVVYGVEVPHHDGRAGMCALKLFIDDHTKFNFSSFFEHCYSSLPRYSIPLFIRITPQMDITGTFKYKKSDLKTQSFNPSKCGTDPIYFINFQKRTFELLDQKIIQAIENGEVKL